MGAAAEVKAESQASQPSPAVADTPVVEAPVSLVDTMDAKSVASTNQKSSSENFLASFSWGDETPPPREEAPQPSSVKPEAHKKNALLAWLGSEESERRGTKPPAPVSVERKSPVPEENSYLKGLDLN